MHRADAMWCASEECGRPPWWSWKNACDGMVRTESIDAPIGHFQFLAAIGRPLNRCGTDPRRALSPAMPCALARNTWCTTVSCGVDWCSSAEILSVAAEMKTNGMLAAGYDHILLDDCWGIRNESTGAIEGDRERFPEGMPALIGKIHDLGFKFGLYTDIGSKACHSPFVGSYPHYGPDAWTFASWSVDCACHTSSATECSVKICTTHSSYFDVTHTNATDVKFDGCGPPGLGHDGNMDNATGVDIVSALVKNMSDSMNATVRGCHTMQRHDFRFTVIDLP